MNSAIPFALTSCFTAHLPRDESSSPLEVLRNPSAAWANFSETLHVPGFLPVRSVRQVLSCGADVCEPLLRAGLSQLGVHSAWEGSSSRGSLTCASRSARFTRFCLCVSPSLRLVFVAGCQRLLGLRAERVF